MSKIMCDNLSVPRFSVISFSFHSTIIFQLDGGVYSLAMLSALNCGTCLNCHIETFLVYFLLTYLSSFLPSFLPFLHSLFLPSFPLPFLITSFLYSFISSFSPLTGMYQLVPRIAARARSEDVPLTEASYTILIKVI